MTFSTGYSEAPMRKIEIRKMLLAQGLGWMIEAQHRPIWLGRPRSKEQGKLSPAPARPKSKLPTEVRGSNGRTYRLNAIGQYQRVRVAPAV